MIILYNCIDKVGRDSFANSTQSDGPYKATPPKPGRKSSSPFGPNPIVPGGKTTTQHNTLKIINHKKGTED